MLTLKMAWRNLWRNRRRTILTFSAVGMGLAVLITLVSFTLGMIEMMVDQIAKSSFGHIQIHQSEYLEQKSSKLVMENGDSLISRIKAVPGVQAVSPRLIFSGAIRSSRSSTIQVVTLTAVDRDSEMSIGSMAEKTVRGEYLGLPEGTDKPDAPLRIRSRKGITIGSRLAELLKVDIGSRIRLDTTGLHGSTTSAAFYVTGVIHTGTDSVDRTQAWVRLKDMQEVASAPDMLHEIAVVVSDSGQIESVLAEIRKAIPEDDIGIEPWWEIAPDLKQTLDISQSWTGFLNFLMLIILSAGILTTMYMVVFERRREFGVRMALGASPGGLFRDLMVEALMIAGLACLVGLSAGGVMVWLLVTFGLDLSWLVGGYDFAGMYIENVYRGSAAPRVFIEPTIVVFIGTVLIAMWPALRVARMRVVDGIRQGGAN